MEESCVDEGAGLRQLKKHLRVLNIVLTLVLAAAALACGAHFIARRNVLDGKDHAVCHFFWNVDSLSAEDSMWLWSRPQGPMACNAKIWWLWFAVLAFVFGFVFALWWCDAGLHISCAAVLPRVWATCCSNMYFGLIGLQGLLPV